MLDTFSQKLLYGSKLPSSLSPMETIDLIGSTYIHYIAKTYFHTKDDIDTYELGVNLARLSLATSLNFNILTDISTPFLIAESADISHQLLISDTTKNFGVISQLLDRAYFFHLADFDANAKVLAQDALKLISSETFVKIIDAKVQYAKCLAHYFSGSFGSLRVEAKKEFSVNTFEERIYFFFINSLDDLSKHVIEEHSEIIDKVKKLEEIQTILTENCIYSNLLFEVNRLLSLIESSKRKAMFPMLINTLQDHQNYISSCISSKNNKGYPFAWPPVKNFYEEYFEKKAHHAVITIPTGSGKSFLAELAIVKTINTGWILYLAPTNALCNQIRRDLQDRLGNVNEIEVLFGDNEYTSDILRIEFKQNAIYVMTPEKALLLSKIYPEKFQSCALVVLDECHILGEQDRGIIAELVLSTCLTKNENIQIILMSALLENGDMLSKWLNRVTNKRVANINMDWRPTRLGRITIAQDKETICKVNDLYKIGIRGYADTKTPWVNDDSLVSWMTDIELESDDPSKFPWNKNEVTSKLAQKFGEQSLKTLIIVLQNKYYPFSIAKTLNFTDVVNTPETQFEFDMFEIANYELGTKSKIKDLIENNKVSVFTAQLLYSERSGSEYAFKNNRTQVLLATSALSQGVNLDAEAVIISGTSFYVAQENEDDESFKNYTLSQILNACGRAARANTACRGFSVIIPDRGYFIKNQKEAKKYILNEMPFLLENENFYIIKSNTINLLQNLVQDENGIFNENQEIISLLPFESNDIKDELQKLIASDILLETDLSLILKNIKKIKEFARFEKIEPWVLESANIAGINYLLGIMLYTGLLQTIHENDFIAPDNTFSSWGELLVKILKSLPLSWTWNILQNHSKSWRWWYKGKKQDPDIISEIEIKGIKKTEPDDNLLLPIWSNLEEVLSFWLSDEDYISIGYTLTRNKSNKKNEMERNSSGNLIPRVMNWKRKVANELSRYASFFSVLRDLWLINEPNSIPNWYKNSDCLQTFSMGIRYGVSDPKALIWYRNFIPERRVSNLLSKICPFEIVDSTNHIQIMNYIKSSKKYILNQEEINQQTSIIQIIKRQLDDFNI